MGLAWWLRWRGCGGECSIVVIVGFDRVMSRRVESLREIGLTFLAALLGYHMAGI